MAKNQKGNFVEESSVTYKMDMKGDEKYNEINEKDNISEKNHKESDILYTVTDVPPWYTSILLALQHYMSMFVGSLSVPFVLSEAICMGEDNVGKSELIGTLFLVCGILTILQILVGVRLPIVQAGTFALLSPTLSFLNLPQYECPIVLENCTAATGNFCVETGSEEHREVWQGRLTIIQGSIMVAAILEVLLGITGAVGFLTRFIGPLSICPTITLLGISLFRSAADYGSANWGICIMSLVLMCVFSQYLGLLDIPFLCYKKPKGCTTFRYPLFKMFPVFISIIVSWIFCAILTATDVFPPGDGARTDVRIDVLEKAPWIRFPYPGQWGMPVVDVSLVFGLFAGLLASVVESVGDYNAVARLSGAPPPPKHAMNRGIMIEGIGCIIAGAFGTGNGTTSTSINVGVVGLTRSGSRSVILLSTIFMIGFALINKFGALFVTIPDPIIGASFIILFGLIVAVGVSNLQTVDINSSRNLFVFGISFFTGLTISEWMKDHPDAIDTGSEVGDNILTVLLSTGMFLGGVIGFVLDNTIPGTRASRGMLDQDAAVAQNSGDSVEYKNSMDEIYGFPCGRNGEASSKKWMSYFPICPAFGSRTQDKVVPEVTIDDDSLSYTSHEDDKHTYL